MATIQCLSQEFNMVSDDDNPSVLTIQTFVTGIGTWWKLK